MPVHHLKTFINAANPEEEVLMRQTINQVAFLFSELAITAADRIIRASAPRRAWNARP
jgi:uncharacterized membrane protein YqhA